MMEEGRWKREDGRCYLSLCFPAELYSFHRLSLGVAGDGILTHILTERWMREEGELMEDVRRKREECYLNPLGTFLYYSLSLSSIS